MTKFSLNKIFRVSADFQVNFPEVKIHQKIPHFLTIDIPSKVIDSLLLLVSSGNYPRKFVAKILLHASAARPERINVAEFRCAEPSAL